MKQDLINDKQIQAWNAVAECYHAYFTGIVLFVVARKGPSDAAELVYEIFCRQRRERFLPGLEKLNLQNLPDAVAAAQYHYLSNHIGGVAVEYMYESDRKAWIRYAAPRWIWADTALCGIPPEVSRAMLAGWHAQNGTMLKNPRLGFVCTKQTVDGQSGLEGYYYEYDHDLLPHERLRFAREEDAPDFDVHAAPKLPTDQWPKARLAKAHRNYAMEYVKSAFSTALQLWGPDKAGHRLHMVGKMIGMQFYHRIAIGVGGPYQSNAEGLSQFLADFARAHGDKAEVVAHRDDSFEVIQESSAFLDGIAAQHPSLLAAWGGFAEGTLQAHNRRLKISLSTRVDNPLYAFRWKISE
ncbi:hypothetical protein EV681_0033 [Advenella incenata]|uniref:Uncharacterized protein n=1 Tax=Advenella incenata TaxID=267800 RepID=A0A4Q7VPY1_9BURK|nr:hypothetical protein [Advenella incenata]RZT98257.1 hypothetical protein EV681_0033 [Advenella incenata]